MGQEVDLFKNAPMPAAFAALGAQHETLAEGIGQSYAVIGYKGKTWSIRYRGERYNFTRADDGEPLSYIDVIILRQGHTKSKSFYKSKEEGGGYDPEASEGKRPVCASLDGITPDADVLEKQADHCAICPRNVWKTSADGKKGRDCTDYKRLAVLIAPALSARIVGSPLLEPVFLRVPPASLNGLAKYGETLDSMGRHYVSLVTRISFDQEKPHPEFKFKAQTPLGDAEAAIVLPLRDSPIALRITGEDQHVEAVQRLEQTQVLKQVEKPKPPVEVVKPKPEPEPEGTGFEVLTNGNAAAKTVAAPVQVEQTSEDTGEATESDAALDAKVAAMLASK
jgi:hypothetical protein